MYLNLPNDNYGIFTLLEYCNLLKDLTSSFLITALKTPPLFLFFFFLLGFSLFCLGLKQPKIPIIIREKNKFGRETFVSHHEITGF